MESDSESEDLDIKHSENNSFALIPSSVSQDETYCSQYKKTLAPSGSFEFTGNSCINEEILSFTQAYQFLNYFFINELVQNFVDETN